MRGPDIDLLSTTEIGFESQDRMLNVPHEIILKPLRLVFANNGTRGGMVTQIDVKLEPAPWFSPSYHGLESEAHHIQVAAGESKEVEVKCKVYTRTWKAYPRELPKELELGEAFRSTLDQHRQGYSDFVLGLSQGQSLGSMRIEFVVTARRRLVSTELKRRSIKRLSLPPLEKSQVEMFREAANLWDDLRPTYREIILDAVGLLKRLQVIPETAKTAASVSEISQIREMPTEFEQWYQPDLNYPFYGDLRNALLQRDEEIDGKLRSFVVLVKEYNEEIARLRLEQSLRTPDLARLRSIGEKLQETASEVIKSSRRYQERLMSLLQK